MKAIKSTVLSIMVLFYGFLNSSNAQWMQVSYGMGNTVVVSLAANTNTIFAGTGGNGFGNGVYLSTNNGTNWTQTSLNNQFVRALAANGNNIFAGTVQYGVYRSTDNGTTWTQTSLSNVYSLAVNGNNVFAGTGGGSVYRSTNNGTTWDTTSLNGQERVYSLAFSGNNIFAGTQFNGLYLSTDNGTTWTQTPLNIQAVLSLAVNGNNIFAGTLYNPPWGAGVYLSTNNGTSWTQTSLNNRDILSLAVNGNNIFAGTYVYPNGYGVYVSTNNGTTWAQRNEGLGNLTVLALCILNNYIYAGAGYVNEQFTGVYRRPLGEFVGIQPISNEVPNQFSLSQNYPNPFNPTTKIKFALPTSSFATLVVYDALGRELETLVSEQLNAGTYEADWDASGFSSGVYYCKIVVRQNAGSSTGDPSAGSGQVFTETKKMILIK